MSGHRRSGLSLECHHCHRIGIRSFVPWGSEGWECANDHACNLRVKRRAEERRHREESLSRHRQMRERRHQGDS